MHPLKVHFVCRGNTYRSRLAEAYFRSLQLANIEVSSSGIQSDVYNAGLPHRYITPQAEMAADQLGIRQYLNPLRTQTSDELLEAADVVVFMSKDVYRDALQAFVFYPSKVVVWDIHDIAGSAHPPHGRAFVKVVRRSIGYNVKRIPSRCHTLAEELTRTSWVDVVDEQDHALGFRLPVAWAMKRRVWWRGCHALITTPSGKYLVEKRSASIVLSPGQIEVSMGGGVDAGETPLHGIQREIHEELGLHVAQDQIRLIDVTRWHSYHPHYRTSTRVILSSYHVTLDTDEPLVHFDKAEVASVDLLSQAQLRRLLRRHYLAGLGPLKYGYVHTSRLVDLVEQRMNHMARR